MSDFNAIRDVSETLRVLLQNQLQVRDPSVVVTVDSPHKEDQPEPRVNLYLYLINQEEHRRNSGGWVPLERQGNEEVQIKEPLALRLYYLLTAFASDGSSEHRLLGESIQILFNNQHLADDDLQGNLGQSPVRARNIQVVLLNMDLDSINSIWGNNVALLRASVAYEVSLVLLEPGVPEKRVPVVQEIAAGSGDPKVEPDIEPVPFLASIEPDGAAPGVTVRITGANLASEFLQVRFEGRYNQVAVVDPEDEGRGPGKLRVVVPATLGTNRRIRVRLQMDRFRSASVPFDILEPTP
ncbi:MAG: DUF4255 domain-containing protein [Proteobacteria bacterium]|nr:DUF4255 domain-containing protein [Pseudomonadota bacterium]